MAMIRALMDGEDASLTCLGILRPLTGEPSHPLSLKKRIVLEQLGKYSKELVTPLYPSAVMRRVAVETPGMSFDSTSCLGVVSSPLGTPPVGYVVRICGGHRFALPVYTPQQLPSSFYRIAGYMAVEDGFVAVAQRRTLFWVLLGLMAGTVFVLAYLLLQYGAEGAWTALTGFFRNFLML